jgi:phospholipid transport system substrate-binding protein
MPATRLLIAAIMWLSLPALAAAQSATDRVNALNQGIIALMKAAEQKVPARTRLQQFEPVVRENYDLETSLRVAASPDYDRAPPDQQKSLLEAFARRSAAQYVQRFTGYSGESFETVGNRPGPRGTTLVETRLIRPNDKPVTLTYVLRQRDGKWGIADVLLDGTISQLAVQRSDYANALRNGGIAALTKELNSYADGVAAGR